MALKGFRWNRGQVIGGIEVVIGKVDNFVRFDPTSVEKVKALEVNDENGRQTPNLELLRRQLQLFTLTAVITFVLAQLLFSGECL